MPSISSIIGESWRFFRKQPVMLRVLLWLFIVPFVGLEFLKVAPEPAQDAAIRFSLHLLPTTAEIEILSSLLATILCFVILWGVSCVILVGKRMVTSKAGRARTSFAAVREDAAKFIWPLFLTALLRACFTLLWGILFVVPGIVYAVRTVLYDIIVVIEGRSYSDALTRSKALTEGRVLRTLFFILGFSFVLFGPSILLPTALLLADQPSVLAISLLTAIQGVLWGFGMFLFTLCTVVLYREYGKSSNT